MTLALPVLTLLTLMVTQKSHHTEQLCFRRLLQGAAEGNWSGGYI